MQSVKEPPCLRGGVSDKCSVREWEDGAISSEEGNTNTWASWPSYGAGSWCWCKKKITLHNNPYLDSTQTPHVVFDILKQHLWTEHTPSHLLTKAERKCNGILDSVECLRGQGRSVEDKAWEVTVQILGLHVCPSSNHQCNGQPMMSRNG